MSINKRPRRDYDKEFKMEAVRLALRGDRSRQAVADSLGTSHTNIHRWIKEFQADNIHAFPGKGRLKPDDEEMHLLKKQLADVKEERDRKKRWPFSQGETDEVCIYSRPSSGIWDRENVPGT